jgi:hypothetical protein
VGSRCLTLPSSGPAFGSPLKSNVRRLWSRRTRPSLKGRATTLSQGHPALQSSPTFPLLLPFHCVARHSRRGPSFPLRWRPAYGTLPAISRQITGRRVTQPGLGVSRLPRRLRSRNFCRSCAYLLALHTASSLATFEATIEHARTVLHRSLCSRLRSESAVRWRARSAHILACLVIEARAGWFSAAA